MLRINGKVIGSPIVTPMPIPDWLQEDEKKADYIKNKPKNVENKDNKMDFWDDDKVSPIYYPSSLAMVEGVQKIHSNMLDVELAEGGKINKTINEAIGDVEASLENIIAKYGLGGDA